MSEQCRRRMNVKTRWCVPLLALLLAACSDGRVAPTAIASRSPTVSTTGSGNSADKIADVFLQLVAISGAQGLDGMRRYAAEQEILTRQDEVRATLLLDSSDTAIVDATALAAGGLGARVTAMLDDRIELVVPLQATLAAAQRVNRPSLFHAFADFAHVRSVRRTPIAHRAATPTPGQSTNAGTTDALAPLGADAWQAAGITGRGVKVGVIDATYNAYKRFLRPTVTVQSFRSDDLIEDPDDDEGILGT